MGRVILLLALVGCGSALDNSVRVSNAAHAAGMATSDVMHVECVEGYKAVRSPAEGAALDKFCVRLTAAYRRVRLGRAALLAAIAAAQQSKDATAAVAQAAELAAALVELQRAEAPR